MADRLIQRTERVHFALSKPLIACDSHCNGISSTDQALGVAWGSSSSMLLASILRAILSSRSRFMPNGIVSAMAR